MKNKKPPTETQGRCRGANNNIGQRGALSEVVGRNEAPYGDIYLQLVAKHQPDLGGIDCQRISLIMCQFEQGR